MTMNRLWFNKRCRIQYLTPIIICVGKRMLFIHSWSKIFRRSIFKWAYWINLFCLFHVMVLTSFFFYMKLLVYSLSNENPMGRKRTVYLKRIFTLGNQTRSFIFFYKPAMRTRSHRCCAEEAHPRKCIVQSTRCKKILENMTMKESR